MNNNTLHDIKNYENLMVIILIYQQISAKN